MDIYVVLPAYNERENIGPLLENLVRVKEKLRSLASLSVIVVDDGSQDGTAEAADVFKNRLSLDLVRREKNMGFSSALRSGLSRALHLAKTKGLEADDVAVVMDADNTQNPKLLPQMAEKILKGFDVVIASRYAPGGSQTGVSLLRLLLSRICGRLLDLLFSIENVKDYTCSYRMIRLTILDKLDQASRGKFYDAESFVCACEFLFNLKNTGAAFAEVPLALRYDLRHGRSKMNIPKTVLGYFRLVWRLLAGKSY